MITSLKTNDIQMKKIMFYIGLLCLNGLLSCSKFLDEKSDKSLSIPKSLDDLQALLDGYSTINQAYSWAGEEASDDYFISTKNWQGIANQDTRNNYIWNDAALLNAAWISPYKVVFVCNTVLEEIDLVDRKNREQEYERVKGTGLFIRAFALYEVVSLFAPVYSLENVKKLGIPVRLSTTIDEDTPRSTVEDTYRQIVGDLKEAATLLPQNTAYKNRPTKQAAYGLLARIYLAMADYPNALDASNKALAYGKELLDYNTVNAGSAAPFTIANEEVIWLASTNSASPLLAPARCRVDTLLFAHYTDDDLRKKAFFTKNADGYYTFKGAYDSRINGFVFKGVALDEIYLIKAECEVRSGNAREGLKSLSVLLDKRYKSSSYPMDFTIGQEEALAFVLKERRKELLFRGLRWTDLKRFNLDPSSAITLVRKIDQQEYTLKPDDPRYVFLIPSYVMAAANFEQNPR